MSILANKLRRLAAELIATADAMQQTKTVVKLGACTYDQASGVVIRGNKRTQLQKAQATILNALLENRGVVVEKDALLVLLFGANAANIISRTVDQHVCMLRKILGDEAIITVNGRGYRT